MKEMYLLSMHTKINLISKTDSSISEIQLFHGVIRTQILDVNIKFIHRFFFFPLTTPHHSGITLIKTQKKKIT